jgi:membrane fusion protein, multidrug efflux system
MSTTTENTVPRPLSPFLRSWRRTGPMLLLGSSLLAVAAYAAVSSQSPVPQAAAPVRPVSVVRVAPVDGMTERSYSGTVRARVETDTGFRVAGKIARRLVDVGTVVKAGQPLAELDQVDLELSMAASDAQAAAAAASARQTSADEERYRALLAKGHVSQAEYDRRRSLADSSRQQLKAAERQRDLAHNRRDYATLRADADGIVTAVMAEAGQVVAEGRPVVRIARSGELEAVVNIPESRLAEVRAGGAEVSFWAESDRRVPATLRELSPDADSVTRSYTARFSLPAGPVAPTLGMTATVHLPQHQGPAIRLPRSAVADFGQGHRVWVVQGDGGTPTAVAVDIVSQGQDSITVRGALTLGMQVVAMGAHRLDGTETVRVVEVRS